MNPTDPVADLAATLGEASLRALIARFYARVPSDPVLAPMYPADDLDGAEQRLADFLVMRCGGSDRYAATRGHPRLRMRHAPFPIDASARAHWVAAMDKALDEPDAQLGELAAEPRERLRSFLHDVATFLVNRG